MGDRMMELEERLEQLVPRGLSEETRGRLEGEIDQLAESVESTPSSRKGRVVSVIAAAACLVVSLSLFFKGPDKIASPLIAKISVAEELPGVEYLGSQTYVTEMTDDGWALEEGSEQPVRYWISMVTETEDLLDNESGYQVRVVSEREMVEPILLTHL